MGTMKRLGLEVLEDIFYDGPATRIVLWERNPVCSWEMFKRLLGKLTVDGVVERKLATPPRTDPAFDTFDLTAEGREIVADLVSDFEE